MYFFIGCNFRPAALLKMTFVAGAFHGFWTQVYLVTLEYNFFSEEPFYEQLQGLLASFTDNTRNRDVRFWSVREARAFLLSKILVIYQEVYRKALHRSAIPELLFFCKGITRINQPSKMDCFCESSWRIIKMNYFPKKFNLICLTGSSNHGDFAWVNFCY